MGGRVFILAIAAAIQLSAGPSAAQPESPVVAACKRAVAHYYMGEQEIGLIQEFSNLTPPRVRMRLKNDVLGGSVSCTFKANAAPLGLIQFCDTLSCHKAGHPRFDEVADLLRRDGL